MSAGSSRICLRSHDIFKYGQDYPFLSGSRIRRCANERGNSCRWDYLHRAVSRLVSFHSICASHSIHSLHNIPGLVHPWHPFLYCWAYRRRRAKDYDNSANAGAKSTRKILEFVPDLWISSGMDTSTRKTLLSSLQEISVRGFVMFSNRDGSIRF